MKEMQTVISFIDTRKNYARLRQFIFELRKSVYHAFVCQYDADILSCDHLITIGFFFIPLLGTGVGQV